MEAKLKHEEGMKFTSTLRSHQVSMDATRIHGGSDSAPSPKELLLSSVMGCTAMDVAALLKKHRQAFSSFEMQATAETTETHPKVFRSIELIYELRSTPSQAIDPAIATKCIDDSLTKYCGVSAMVSEVSPIYYTLKIDGEIEGRGQAKFELRERA
jgi:putative redox protein